MKVTGHDGANPITDAQIAELRSLASEAGEGLIVGEDFYSPATVLTMCDEATGELDYGDTFAELPIAMAPDLIEARRLWSRNRLAEAWNERNAGKAASKSEDPPRLSDEALADLACVLARGGASVVDQLPRADAYAIVRELQEARAKLRAMVKFVEQLRTSNVDDGSPNLIGPFIANEIEGRFAAAVEEIKKL